MSSIKGARERARAEVTALIKEEARRQLVEQGAAKLSLRAVARELGMVSSALYRYFPSRDELLTALIIDAYDAIGAAAEAAFTRSGGGRDPLERWITVCYAIREWALTHPHEYALIYGSPVPGYAAPQDTVAPASRIGLVLISLACEAHAAGMLCAADLPEMSEAVHRDVHELAEQVGVDLPPAALAGLIAAWAKLFGLISFELFGQFHRVIEARDEFFANAAAELAHGVGMRPVAAASRIA